MFFGSNCGKKLNDRIATNVQFGQFNGQAGVNCHRQIKNDLSLVPIIAPHRREV